MEQQLVQLDMGQLQSLLSNSILETVKGLGMDKVDRKHGVFPTTTKEEYEKMTKDQRLRQWVKAIFTKDPLALLNVKAMSEGTTTAGGFLVPEEFRLDVIHEAELFGVVRKNAFIFPTSVDTINLAADDGTVTITWENESAQIDESTPTLAGPTISIKKAAGITAMSNELLADSQFPIVQYLATLFGEEIARAEDTQGLTGTGSPITGMLSATGINSVTMTSTSIKDVTSDDLLDLSMAVAAKYRAGSSYFMHPTIFSYVRKQKASGSGEYVVQMPTNAGGVPTIWGFPVIESEVMPSTDASGTAFVGFGNMKKRLYLADRQQMTVTIGKEGTVGSNNLFEKDMSAVRVTERVGMVWTLGAGLAKLKTAS